MTDVRAIWIEASGVVMEAAADDRVGVRWNAPSSLPEMTIGSLVGHLLHSGILLLELSLEADPPPGRPLDVGEVFALIPADPGDRVHDAVRAVADHQKDQGPELLLEAASACRARMIQRLGSEPGDRVISMAFGDYGVPMTLDDFVSARVLELAVHLDDLAASIGGFDVSAPPSALSLTSQLGLEIALRRHGAHAVMRSLFRPSRYGIDAIDPLR